MTTRNDILSQLRVDDRWSRYRLASIGLRHGMRCLEVGAGAGTMAHWLAEQVGPGGEVVATDSDPSCIPAHPRITPLRHDIATDPLDGEPYDLIYARSVLAYRPDPPKVVRRLAEALAPGGTLVIEEFDLLSGGWVLDAPNPTRAQRQLDDFHRLLNELWRRSGGNPDWCREMPLSMGDAGLVDIHVEAGGAASWRSGEAGCLNLQQRAAHFRAKHEASTNRRSRRVVNVMRAIETLAAHPRVAVVTGLRISAAGRRESS